MIFEKNKDVILGVIIVLGALLFLFVLIPYGIRLPKTNAVPSLSPDFWTRIISWGMLAIGMGLTFSGIKQSRKGLVVDEKAGDMGYYPWPKAVALVVSAMVLLFVYQQMIPVIGMIAASVAAVLIFTFMSGERRWRTTLIIAAVLPLVLYYFFLKVASIPMPLGIFDQ